MQYEEALKEWGYLKLIGIYGEKSVNKEKVTVEIEFNEGYACCNGQEPDCYCSLAQSPSASVVVKSERLRWETEAYDFDFAKMLGEIVQAAGGNLTS